MGRILITGWPKTGKTTTAHKMLNDDPGIPCYSTDALIGMGWSEASQFIADHWLTMPAPWIIEGVAIPRALRKWKAAHPGEALPYDKLIILDVPYVTLDTRQIGMGKGHDKVLHEVLSGTDEEARTAER